MQGTDVRMRELRDRLRFSLEPLLELDALRQVRRKHLDRHVSVEPRVLRAVDLAHPARAEGSEDLVRAELIPRLQAHRFVSSSRQLRTTWMRGTCFSQS